MTTNRLKLVLGMIILVSYCLEVGLTFLFKLTGHYSEVEFKTIMAALQPVSLAFVSFVIADAIRNKETTKPGRILNPGFCLISILLPVFHAFIIVSILIEQTVHHYSSESLIQYLSSAESSFGLCLGAIMRSLFDDDH